MDGFGESAGVVGAAAEFVQDPPVFELGVGAFAGAAEPGVGAVGFLAGFGLVTAFVRGDHVLAGLVIAVVALVAQGDQPSLAQGGENLPDAGGCGVMG